jgi:cell division protein FtsL
VAGIDSVVKPDMGSRRGIGVSAFLLAVVTAGAMAHVGVRMKGIEVAYALGHERRINTELEEERRRLNIEIGMLKDPVRVVSIARDKLKMGPPAPADIVRHVPGPILGARPAEATPPARRPERATAPKPRARAATAAQPVETPPTSAAANEAQAEAPPAAAASAAGRPAPEGRLAPEGDE